MLRDPLPTLHNGDGEGNFPLAIAAICFFLTADQRKCFTGWPTMADSRLLAAEEAPMR